MSSIESEHETALGGIDASRNRNSDDDQLSSSVIGQMFNDELFATEREASALETSFNSETTTDMLPNNC